MTLRERWEEIDYQLLLPTYARFPDSLALSMARMQGRLRRRFREPVSVAIQKHAQHWLPGCTFGQARRIAAEVFATCAIDDLWTFWLARKSKPGLFHAQGRELLEPDGNPPGGTLLMTGHFGPIAAFLYWLGRELGHPFNLLAEPLERVPNRTDAWLRYGHLRESSLANLAQRPIIPATSQSYFSLRRLLKQGETIIVAADVPPRPERGSRVQFLNRTARFPDGGARLYLDTRARVIHFRVGNPRKGRHKIHLTELTPLLSEASSVEQVAQILTLQIEESLKQAAGEWHQWEVAGSFFERG